MFLYLSCKRKKMTQAFFLDLWEQSYKYVQNTYWRSRWKHWKVWRVQKAFFTRSKTCRGAAEDVIIIRVTNDALGNIFKWPLFMTTVFVYFTLSIKLLITKCLICFRILITKCLICFRSRADNISCEQNCLFSSRIVSEQQNCLISRRTGQWATEFYHEQHKCFMSSRIILWVRYSM